MSGTAAISLVRPPCVAGRFYPDDAEECSLQADRFVHAGSRVAPPGRWIGGIVPHAGWIASGAVAGETIAAIATTQKPEVVVIFGAVHTRYRGPAAADSFGAWGTPGPIIRSAARLREGVCRGGPVVRDDSAHENEHAIEVELPLVRRAWPAAELLAIEVPPDARAASVGEWVAEAVDRMDMTAIYLASSDLTHYGPGYGFAPAGGGEQGLEFAAQNDLRLIELALELKADAIVPVAVQRANACGPGAIAAMLAACRVAGAAEAKLIRRTSSAQTLAAQPRHDASNAVGYCSLVVGTTT